VKYPAEVLSQGTYGGSESAESSLLRSSGELSAAALYAPGMRGLDACRALLQESLLLGLAVSVVRYMGPTMVELTGDEKVKAMESLPPPPIAIPSEAHMFVSAEPSRQEEVGDLLHDFAPAIRTWLDLELPCRVFEEWSAPQALDSVRELLNAMPDLKVVLQDIEARA
jgi:hypothetical protein